MAAIAFTKVLAAADQLVYSWLGDAAGTLTYATLVADATVTGPLLTALQAITGECNTNGKATSALISGAAFSGTSGTTRQTWIQTIVLNQTPIATGLLATDSGGDNQPLLTLTPAADTNGMLFITHIHSVVR